MDFNQLAIPFDATQYEPFVGGFRTYPAGTYLMAITDLNIQYVKGSTESWMLRVEYTIYSDPHMHEKYTEFLGIGSTSDAAREISLRKLSAICHAVGKLQVQNLTELANLPMWNELDFQEAVQGGIDPISGREVKAQPARNNVIRREPYSADGQPARAANPPIQASPTAAQAAAAPPMASPMPQASPAAPAAPMQAGARQTPPPFAAKPNGANGAAPIQQATPAPQQPAAGSQTQPPWLQPK